jgi:hypothetical protein
VAQNLPALPQLRHENGCSLHRRAIFLTKFIARNGVIRPFITEQDFAAGEGFMVRWCADGQQPGKPCAQKEARRSPRKVEWKGPAFLRFQNRPNRFILRIIMPEANLV